MAIITKIEAQKKRDDRVNIYVDEEFFMAIFAELVYTFNLKKGMTIEEENLKNILNEEMYIKAKNKALNILAKADQSEKKIKQKLSTDFEDDIIDMVIEFLKKNKFIDDDLLAQKIVNTNVNLNRCGKNKIKQNLYNKGIDKESIDEAISDIDNDVEFENALYLGKKRYERVKNEDKRKIYQKISQHLSYKGFNYDIIKRVLNKLLNDDEFNM
ncbi:recombination regulator RecX [Romboutsia sedimentorum]|jgi:regulatory protein|uniref:Regulatory protein RecX n=1 Tax=Romboutsia sedimentorum TaxID=1368474 RepID=A0ABT7EA40_9FIRM|nr:recombination regulator RecX [Romboutsia sedimentorum]MDK2562836.1 recombination regulator RecX [Romboutsia sedimentorum]MDK2585681.1 recombination regulator RecX [Romboutsia sedimentorum]